VNPPSVRQGYDVANPPRYFVELAGADHVRFADIDISDTQLPGIVSRVAGGTNDVAADATLALHKNQTDLAGNPHARVKSWR